MAEKAKKQNGIQRYFSETVGELRKVSWPTRQEAVQLTIIVLIVMVFMGAFLGLVDLDRWSCVESGVGHLTNLIEVSMDVQEPLEQFESEPQEPDRKSHKFLRLIQRGRKRLLRKRKPSNRSRKKR